MDNNIIIRHATRADMAAVLRHIKKLAKFERAPQAVMVTVDELEQDGFGFNPLFQVTLAEVDGNIVGMVFYYEGYSTWKGKLVFLEDLYVDDNYRRKGIASKLIDKVIEYAQLVNAKRVKWQVLNWNEPAKELYKKYNVDFDEEWIDCNLTYEQIKNFKPKQ